MLIPSRPELRDDYFGVLWGSFKESFKHFLTKIAEEYDNYKGKYKFPSSLKGTKIK